MPDQKRKITNPLLAPKPEPKQAEPKAPAQGAQTAELTKEVAEVVTQVAAPAPVVVDQQTPQPPAVVQAPEALVAQPEPTPPVTPKEEPKQEEQVEPVHWGFRFQQDRFRKPKIKKQAETPPMKYATWQIAQQMVYIDLRQLPEVLHACELFDGKNNGLNAIIAMGLQAMGYDITPETLNQRFRASDIHRIEGLSPESIEEIKKRLPKGIDY